MVEHVSDVDALSRKAHQEAQEHGIIADSYKVYPQSVKGFFRKIKWWTVFVLLAVFAIGPLIRWDRGEGVADQAILMDMAARRGYFFWIEIWPQEVYYLMGLLIMGAFGLFFVTSMFGRVWCGYTCPQTVWTDIFLWVERQIEGDRNARMKFDKSPLSIKKLSKQILKHLTWIAISMVTALIWCGYFQDFPTLVADFFTLQADYGSYGFVLLFTATTYLLGGLAREAVCTYMCPWPRFQAAMLDTDSLIVTYQKWRGEPRGKQNKRKKADDGALLGDCIDCNRCVAVCPTGIDIRDGNQLACIGCGLCIDACDDVMTRIGKAKSLITYSTTRIQQDLSKGLDKPKTRIVRPRTVIYAMAMVLFATIFVWSLSTRATMDMNIQRDRNPLFIQLSNGDIRNGYTFKLINKASHERQFEFKVEGLPGDFKVWVSEHEKQNKTSLTLRGLADDVTTYRILISTNLPPSKEGAFPILISLRDIETGESLHEESVFRGPRSR